MLKEVETKVRNKLKEKKVLNTGTPPITLIFGQKKSILLQKKDLFVKSLLTLLSLPLISYLQSCKCGTFKRFKIFKKTMWVICQNLIREISGISSNKNIFFKRNLFHKDVNFA